MKNWNLILYKIQITRIQAEGNQWYLDNSTLPLTRSTSPHFYIILSSITRTTFCAWQVGKKNCPLQYSLSLLSNQFKYSFPLNIKQAFLLKSFCKRTLYLWCCWSEVCMIRAFPSQPRFLRFSVNCFALPRTWTFFDFPGRFKLSGNHCISYTTENNAWSRSFHTISRQTPSKGI